MNIEKCVICSGCGIVWCQCVEKTFCAEHFFEHLEDQGKHSPKYLYDNEFGLSDIGIDEKAMQEIGINVSGHKAPVNGLGVSSGLVFTGERDGIYMWEDERYTVGKMFYCGVKVLSVAIGDCLVAGGLDTNEVVLIDYLFGYNGTRSFYTKHFPVFSVLFIKNGKWLAAASGKGFIEIFDLNGETVLLKQLHKNQILALAGDSKIMVSGSRSGKMAILSLDTLTKIYSMKYHLKAVVAIQISADFIYSGSFDKTLIVFSLSQKSIIKKIPHQAKIFSLFFSSPLLYFSDSEGLLTVINPDDPLKVLKRHKEPPFLRSLQVKDSKIYMIVSDSHVRVLNFTDIESVPVGPNELVFLKYTKDRQYLLCGYKGETLIAINLRVNKIEYVFDSLYEVQNNPLFRPLTTN